MLFASILSSLVLALVCLALSHKSYAAPTHHLTIGVQGNTPTLMVTSAETDITKQLMSVNKKPAKLMYNTKNLKDSDVPKKVMKSKFIKNQSLINKKDKLQHLTKSQLKLDFKEHNHNNNTTSSKPEENKNEILNQTFNETVSRKAITEILVINKTNFQLTTLPPKQMNDMLVISSFMPQTTTTESPLESSTLLPSNATDTSSIPFAITDNDNLKISPAVTTTLSPKDYEVITSLNNDDDTYTTTIQTNLTQTETATRANDDVALQTQTTTQISTETSFIKMANEDDNDRYIHESIAIIDNENLLLTTIETNAFTTPTTPAEILTPSTVTSKTNNAQTTAATREMLDLSFIMTTTENVADDNGNRNSEDEQQQKELNKNKNFKDNLNTAKKDKATEHPFGQEYQKTNILFETAKERITSTTSSPQFEDEIKSTTQSSLHRILNATENKFPENSKTQAITKMELTTPKQILLTTEKAQKIGVAAKATIEEFHEISLTTEKLFSPQSPPSNTLTTETILKLIDLEKQVVQPLDELKQSSLLMQPQHDNGHDGLKNIKKKQLIDKHYEEALIPHKQEDLESKGTKEDHVLLNKETSHSSNASQSSLTGHKSLLMPIEHGSLGPIIMQERTFHIIHGEDKAKQVKNQAKKEMDAHLRRGHFVELKAQPVLNENFKEIMAKKRMPKEDEYLMEMQSDQPAEVTNYQNEDKMVKQINKNLEDIKTLTRKLEAVKQSFSTEGLLHETKDSSRLDENLKVSKKSTLTTKSTSFSTTAEPKLKKHESKSFERKVSSKHGSDPKEHENTQDFQKSQQTIRSFKADLKLKQPQSESFKRKPSYEDKNDLDGKLTDKLSTTDLKLSQPEARSPVAKASVEDGSDLTENAYVKEKRPEAASAETTASYKNDQEEDNKKVQKSKQNADINDSSTTAKSFATKASDENRSGLKEVQNMKDFENIKLTTNISKVLEKSDIKPKRHESAKTFKSDNSGLREPENIKEYQKSKTLKKIIDGSRTAKSKLENFNEDSSKNSQNNKEKHLKLSTQNLMIKSFAEDKSEKPKDKNAEEISKTNISDPPTEITPDFESRNNQQPVSNKSEKDNDPNFEEASMPKPSENPAEALKSSTLKKEQTHSLNKQLPKSGSHFESTSSDASNISPIEKLQPYDVGQEHLEPKFYLEKVSNIEENQRKETIAANIEDAVTGKPYIILEKPDQKNIVTAKATDIKLAHPSAQKLKHKHLQNKSDIVLSTTVFQVADTVATKTPIVQAETLFTLQRNEKPQPPMQTDMTKQQTESKISDIQIEVYDSTVDSIVAATNFKDNENKQQPTLLNNEENYLGKTTRPPIAVIQQERFTQYVIDRTETSTHEPINYNTVQVASGKPEPAAIEIHINVSESFGNESEDLEFSYPQTEYINNHQNEKNADESYDENKVSDNIKLKIPSNFNNINSKDARNDEILVVEIIDTENNNSDSSPKEKTKIADELFITDVKHMYTTPPPPPPPPPFQTNFDRDSDTIFYISNTEVKVGESMPSSHHFNEERKLKLESQFFPANYMASTHSSLNINEDINPNHHIYEEDIILSSSRNQADSLKIYRNSNEPSPPLDVTYVGESIIEVEQSPDTVITTTYAPDQIHNNMETPQADVIIQPAILPEISIGVPVIGELPPQIELKEIDFMPNEAQLHRSGIYDDNDNSNNNDIDDNTINGSSNNNNNHDVDMVSGNSNSNSNQHIDESSIQYGGDLIDESADGGFDGVEGSYPFGNPALVKKSSSSYSSGFLAKLQKQQPLQEQQQQPNHVADYAHLYVNYGVNNMRKDELTADVKDSGELLINGNVGNGNTNFAANDQNLTTFKDFLSKTGMNNNSIIPLTPVNSTPNERISNATAFSVMEDVNDLEDKNTENIINLISLAIGLFIVILPVVVTCSMFWALRYLYKKYHSSLTEGGGYADQSDRKIPLNEDGAEKGEYAHETSSSPTNSHKDTIENYPETSNKPSTTSNSIVKFASEKPIPNLENSSPNINASKAANYPSAIASKKNEALKLSLALSSPITQNQAKSFPTASSSPSKPTSSAQTHYEHDDIVSEARDDDDVEMPGPNGSITKMTLENNLLIVETEERNDISRVARETKMDYNKDGVFVVEVARGIDSKTIPESPVTDGNEKMLSMFDTKQNNGGLCYKITNEKSCDNHEKVQIHSPPPDNHEEGPRSLHQIEEVEEPINSPQFNENNEGIVGLDYKANTGLSQSDLSDTSSSDSNKGYCYGNQELYVVEQKGYSPVALNGNVVLKCDSKDIKDDDHNPGNDRYLEHSPDKKDDFDKDREDSVEAGTQFEEGGFRTKSGESPEQKQNERSQENHDDEQEDRLEIQENNNSHTSPTKEKNTEEFQDIAETKDINFEATSKYKAFSIPVEIEVHITPPQLENSTEDEQLPPYQASMEQQPYSEENIESEPKSLEPENVLEVVEGLPNAESSNQSNLPVTKEKSIENYEAESTAITNNYSDKQAAQNHVDSNENGSEETGSASSKIEHTEKTKKNCTAKINDDILEEEENEKEEHAKVSLNDLKTNGLIETENLLQVDVLTNDFKQNETIDDKKLFTDEDDISKTEKYNNEEKLCNGQVQSEIIENMNNSLENTKIEPNEQLLENGYADEEHTSSTLNSLQNGYESIVSFPEPPPTTDEQLNNDLSEQQLDSLPPPPPPEVFNLKDLPPPLANGNVDSPESEESNSFYNSLPPPPPTTLEVTVPAEATTNGKVHASPLTPPASPPALFTNNLHAGLCSQAIAVDVNGS